MMQGRTPSQRPLYEMATVYQPHTDHKLESTMTILRSLERPESWPVAAIKVKSSGIRIFIESGLEERLIVKTTVRFLDHLVCPFILMSSSRAKSNKIIYFFLAVVCLATRIVLIEA